MVSLTSVQNVIGDRTNARDALFKAKSHCATSETTGCTCVVCNFYRGQRCLIRGNVIYLCLFAKVHRAIQTLRRAAAASLLAEDLSEGFRKQSSSNSTRWTNKT